MSEDRYHPEAALMGMAFLDVAGAMRKAHAAGVKPEHFEHETRKEIWAAMLANYNAGIPTDPYSLVAKTPELLPFAGDMVTWMEAGWITLNPDAFISALIERHHEQDLKALAADVFVGKLSQHKFDLLRKKMDASPKAEGHSLPSWKISRQLVSDFDKRIMAYRAGKPLGLPTGWSKLDKLILGWQPESFSVIAARSGMGKTTLAVNLALNAAKRQKRVLFFSLEMEMRAVASRMYANLGGFSSARCLEGSLADDDIDRLHHAMKTFDSMPVQICTKVKDSHLDEVVREIRKQHERDPLSLVIVDQISHINVGKMTRREEVIRITRSMKALAKDTGLPIVCLNQIGRPKSDQKIGPPNLWDLKESGSVEEDADAVLMLHRESAYGIGKRNTIYVRKSRNGQVGEFDIGLDLECQRMSPL